MLIQAHKIDINGFVIEPIVVNQDENVTVDIIKEPMPNGLYKPRWVDGEWGEGKTGDEFVEDAFLSSLQPSQIEIEKAERQLETLELLIELEVI